MGVVIGEQIRVNIDYVNQGQKCTCGIGYVSAVNDPDRTALSFAQDFWFHIRNEWRFLQPSSVDLLTQSIRIASITDIDEGMFGTFPIPDAEQIGIESDRGDLAPPFVAAALRFNVEGRRTRPGQMRVSLLAENDLQSNRIVGNAITYTLNLAARLAQGLPNRDFVPITIAYPTVFGAQVIAESPVLSASRIVSGTASDYFTSQVSRKIGRGQ